MDYFSFNRREDSRTGQWLKLLVKTTTTRNRKRNKKWKQKKSQTWLSYGTKEILTSTSDLKLFDPSDSFIILKSRSGMAEKEEDVQTKQKLWFKRKYHCLDFATSVTFSEIDMSGLVSSSVLRLEVVEKTLKINTIV